MIKKDLIRLIREVVKREIKSVVKQELNEALGVMEQGKVVNKQKSILNKKANFTKNPMLNSILNETANNNSGEFEAYPEVSANSLRSKFTDMQNGALQQMDLNNRPVDTSKLDPSIDKALTRDYSELVKRFK